MLLASLLRTNEFSLRYHRVVKTDDFTFMLVDPGIAEAGILVSFEL
jgi:hypothetical protein